MTSKEEIAKLNVLSSYETSKEKHEEYKECIYSIIKDLDLLDLYKKFFKYSLTEIQWIKYLVLPDSGDIRRPDSLLRITDEEYEILKEGLENDK